MEGSSWREIEHTADWALEVWGSDQAALFRNAALGMADLLRGRPSGERSSKGFELTAPDMETLLVDWLTELLFWLDEGELMLEDVSIEAIQPTSLIGTARATRGTDLVRHIKAVTFNELAIRADEAGLKTTIVFDV
jgi:SHS2 domain-containing protein